MSITESLRERKKRRTAEELYDAALELFTDRPYAEVTVEEICERAEVGRATFFRFYGSKAGLLTEFNRRLAGSIAERIESDPASSATDQLWIVQDEIARTWGASGPAMREMAREWIRNATAREFTADTPHPELLDLVTAIVARGQQAGELVATKPARFVAWLVIGALSAVTAGWLGNGDDATLAHGTHDALELLLGGLTR
ncbi:MAG: TetR/AcrR family transcriptional regulator [Acidimicrobiales bacterium]